MSRAIEWILLGAGSCTAIIVGLQWHRPARIGPWLLLAGAVFALAVGDVFYAFEVMSAATGCYLAMFVLVAGALLRFTEGGSVLVDRARLIDLLAFACSALLVIWVFVIADNSPWVRISASDVIGSLLLVGVALRLNLATGRNVSAMLLLAGSVGLLAGDVLFPLLQSEGSESGYRVLYIAWGLAALHPSMVRLTQPMPPRTTRWHGRWAALLGASVATPPVVLLIEALDGTVRDGVPIAIAGAITLTLTITRLADSVTLNSQALTRERGLRSATADLVSATDIAAVDEAVRAGVAALIPSTALRRVVFAPDDRQLAAVQLPPAPPGRRPRSWWATPTIEATAVPSTPRAATSHPIAPNGPTALNTPTRPPADASARSRADAPTPSGPDASTLSGPDAFARSRPDASALSGADAFARTEDSALSRSEGAAPGGPGAPGKVSGANDELSGSTSPEAAASGQPTRRLGLRRRPSWLTRTLRRIKRRPSESDTKSQQPRAGQGSHSIEATRQPSTGSDTDRRSSSAAGADHRFRLGDAVHWFWSGEIRRSSRSGETGRWFRSGGAGRWFSSGSPAPADEETTLVCPLWLEPLAVARPSGGALILTGRREALTAAHDALEVLAGQAALALDRISLVEAVGRRDSDLYLRAVISNTADLMLVLDEDQRIRYASPALHEVLGDEKLSPLATLEDLVHPDDRGQIRRAFATGGDGTLFCALRRPDHSQVLVEATYRDLRDDRLVQGFVVTMQNVSDTQDPIDRIPHRDHVDELPAWVNRRSAQHKFRY
ncbi:PAS domain-containing protein [Actinoplanes sp. Pm04-4]|uniref:PAS domain-containing protein n=1 Tax=Paractinoplanes pyxinae TaxID=2997416 RepID=A0ABT4B792_9ACTN|nr:PAS domain-containing protein [Actinoplanes pyxinae]MCY1141730.1 PAS domain-containing protein [Actinoplanes pyxinae]